MNIMSPSYELSSTFMNPGAYTLGMALLFATFFPVGSFISSALLGWLDNKLQNEASTDGFHQNEEDIGQIRSRRSSQSSTEEMENRTFLSKINSNLEFGFLREYVFFTLVLSHHSSALLKCGFKLFTDSANLRLPFSTLFSFYQWFFRLFLASLSIVLVSIFISF